MKKQKIHYVCLATDICVFSRKDGQLQVLLIRRDKEPFKGNWALPGGRLEPDETLEQCAARELMEETGLHPDRIWHFANFSNPQRDPRVRTVSAAYFAWITNDINVIAGSDASAAEWFQVSSLPPLAFDHNLILQAGLLALERLPEKF